MRTAPPSWPQPPSPPSRLVPTAAAMTRRQQSKRSKCPGSEQVVGADPGQDLLRDRLLNRGGLQHPEDIPATPAPSIATRSATHRGRRIGDSPSFPPTQPAMRSVGIAMLGTCVPESIRQQGPGTPQRCSATAKQRRHRPAASLRRQPRHPVQLPIGSALAIAPCCDLGEGAVSSCPLGGSGHEEGIHTGSRMRSVRHGGQRKSGAAAQHLQWGHCGSSPRSPH